MFLDFLNCRKLRIEVRLLCAEMTSHFYHHYHHQAETASGYFIIFNQVLVSLGK